MPKIRAFVGHSFEQKDDFVVRKFLDYLTELTKSFPSFSWEHARAAETKDLAEKVLAKMQNKNLFIGICTKKERAVNQSNLIKPFFSPKRLAGNANSFEWKTSDWIIQEIGLAIGKDMKLLLLVEDGVRRPGGLQGNHEYISFDKEFPEKSFQKISEAVRSVTPKSTGIQSEAIKPSVETEQADSKQEIGGEDWFEPKPNWTMSRYKYALMHMIIVNDEDGVNKITAAYLKSNEGKLPQSKQEWIAIKELYNMRFGKGGNLSNLKKMAKKYPNNPMVQKCLAEGFLEYDDKLRAADLFEKTARETKDNATKFALYSDAVFVLMESEKTQKAEAIIYKMKHLASMIEGGDILFINVLRKVAEKNGDMDMLYGLTEKLLCLNPDDSDARFSLAYSYSQDGLNDASLFHYLKIPFQNREPSTWNNLGVEFDHFGLVSKSVEAYQKSEKDGETLAMSNLAFKFIKAGFLEEAKEICTRALKIEDYHKNVIQAISRVTDVPEEEEKKVEDIIDKSKPKIKFYSEYGHAILRDDVAPHKGRWKGPDCELRVAIEGKRFVAEGQYSLPGIGTGRLGNALLGSKTRDYKIRYEGIVSGHSIKCIVIREALDAPSSVPTIFGEGDKEVTALMVISESIQEISVYEPSGTKKGASYKLSFIE